MLSHTHEKPKQTTTQKLLGFFHTEPEKCEKEPETDKADFWTKLTTVGDAIGSFLGSGYWIAQLIDSFTHFEPEFADFSTPALATGFSIAFLSTLGAGYIHYILNMNHQKAKTYNTVMTAEDKKIFFDMINKLEDSELMNDKNARDDTLKVLIDLLIKYGIIQEKPVECEKTGFSWLQKLAFAGDILSHFTDSAGTPTFFYNKALKNPTLTVNIFCQLFITVFGFLNSYATLRICAHNVTFFNANQAKNNALSDAEEEKSYYLPLQDQAGDFINVKISSEVAKLQPN